MKAGIGFARFGNSRRGETELRRALEIAVAHDLHELVFRIEPVLNGINKCGAPEEVESAAPCAPYSHESLSEVSASLAALGAVG